MRIFATLRGRLIAMVAALLAVTIGSVAVRESGPLAALFDSKATPSPNSREHVSEWSRR